MLHSYSYINQQIPLLLQTDILILSVSFSRQILCFYLIFNLILTLLLLFIFPFVLLENSLKSAASGLLIFFQSHRTAKRRIVHTRMCLFYLPSVFHTSLQFLNSTISIMRLLCYYFIFFLFASCFHTFPLD